MIPKANAIALLFVLSSLHIPTDTHAAAPAAGAGSEGKKAHDSKFQSEADAAQYRAVVQFQDAAATVGLARSQAPTLAAASAAITKIQCAHTKSTSPFAHVYSKEDPQTLASQYKAIIHKILPLELQPRRKVHEQNIKFALWTHNQLVIVTGKEDTGKCDTYDLKIVDTIHFLNNRGEAVKEIPFRLPPEGERDENDVIEVTDTDGKKRLEYRTIPPTEKTDTVIDNYDSLGMPNRYAMNLPPLIDAISYNPFKSVLGMLVRTRAEGSDINSFSGWCYRTLLYNLKTGNFINFEWWKHDSYRDGKSSSDYLLDWQRDCPHVAFTHPQIINNSPEHPIEQITHPSDLYFLKPSIYGKNKWNFVTSEKDQAAYICDTDGRKIYKLPNQHRATIIAWGPDDQLVTAFKDMPFLHNLDPRRLQKGDDCKVAYLWEAKSYSQFIEKIYECTPDQLKLPRILEDQSTEFRKNNGIDAPCSLADCAQGAKVTIASLVRVLKTFPAAIAAKLLEHYKISRLHREHNHDGTLEEKDCFASAVIVDRVIELHFAEGQNPHNTEVKKALEGYIVG